MIYGNSQAQSDFRTWFQSHHSTIALIGPQHLGKTSFVREFLEREVPEGDFMFMESGVDGVRSAREFLHTRALHNEYRILVVNDADVLLDSSQDALLKLTEEPPEGVRVILVTHDIGRIKPALRSRIRILNQWSPLSITEMRSMISGLVLPEHEESLDISRGFPGIYVNIAASESFFDLFNVVFKSLETGTELFMVPIPEIIKKMETGSNITRDCVIHILRQAVCRTHYHARSVHVLNFCSLLQTSTSLNAEIHWARMAQNMDFPILNVS